MNQYKYNQEENVLHIALSGRFDTMQSMEIEERLINYVKESKLSSPNPDDLEVNLNLAQVEFISSSFMRICLNVAKMVSQNKFKVTNANDMIKQTFQISGFDVMLNLI